MKYWNDVRVNIGSVHVFEISVIKHAHKHTYHLVILQCLFIAALGSQAVA